MQYDMVKETSWSVIWERVHGGMVNKVGIYMDSVEYINVCHRKNG